MHALDPSCKILYASDSITDVLGYLPSEVTNKSTFEFFHPDELPMVKNKHRDVIAMDHASVLAYVKVKNNEGEWLGCECIFSCVYDVIVAATTIYRQGPRSEGRAIAVPIIHKVLQSSREKVRYEMFAHMSARFTSIAPNLLKEVRCALILNRFTQSLSILYSTHAIYDLVGLDPASMISKSFLDYLAPDCLDGAVDAINRAKENDSVAYMRFCWRNPDSQGRSNSESSDSSTPSLDDAQSGSSLDETSSADPANFVHDMEAVISCTSDGIVVVLRRTSPSMPTPTRGLFSVPWSSKPMYPAPPEPADADAMEDIQSDALQSIQDISVFIWGLNHGADVVRQHAVGEPGPLAVHPEAGPIAVSKQPKPVRSEQAGKCNGSGSSTDPIAIDLETD